MKVVSWNYRGLGQREKRKEKAMGNLNKIERPHILLIQETKMQGSEALREMKQIWKTSSGIDLNASGVPGGICTV
jgi:exonuclease III